MISSKPTSTDGLVVSFYSVDIK